jgi:hypothetical protein
MKKQLFLLLLFVFFLHSISLQAQTTRFVKNYPPNFYDDFYLRQQFCAERGYFEEWVNWDFTCWDTASPDLQLAINVSEPGDIIFVQAGTYVPVLPFNVLPDLSDDCYNYFFINMYHHSYDRSNTFYLKSGVKIYGGFEGHEGCLSGRELQNPNNETILSGLLANGERVYNVVTVIGCDEETVLDGFTITNGNATLCVPHGYYYMRPTRFNSGGGIYSEHSSATFRNLIITGNNAYLNGGGFYEAGSSSRVLNSIIWNNTAAFGAGIFITYSDNIQSETVVGNTLISGNRAHFRGAGVFNISSSPVFVNTTISGNYAKPLFLHLNTIGCEDNPYSLLYYAEQAANDIFQGGGIYDATDPCSGFGSSLYLYNSIVWGNGAGDDNLGENFEIYSETGMIAGNCLFENPGRFNYIIEVGSLFYHDECGPSSNIQPCDHSPFNTPWHFECAPVAGGYYDYALCCCPNKAVAIDVGDMNYYYQYIGDPIFDFDLKLDGRLNNYGGLDIGAYTFRDCSHDHLIHGCLYETSCP